MARENALRAPSFGIPNMRGNWNNLMGGCAVIDLVLLALQSRWQRTRRGLIVPKGCSTVSRRWRIVRPTTRRAV
jgi:hypothetical protein